MHPDSILAGLRRELTELRPGEDGRRKEIEAEIKHAEALPKPAPLTNTGQRVRDTRRAYLDGLKQELASAAKERHEEIKAEIKRVEDALRKETAVEKSEEAQVEPSEAEVEQRKRVRGGKKDTVEQARSAPVPDQTAPASGAKE